MPGLVSVKKRSMSPANGEDKGSRDDGNHLPLALGGSATMSTHDAIRNALSSLKLNGDGAKMLKAKAGGEQEAFYNDVKALADCLNNLLGRVEGRDPAGGGRLLPAAAASLSSIQPAAHISKKHEDHHSYLVPPMTVSNQSCEMVVTSNELISHIFGYAAGGIMGRRQLSALALVSKQWSILAHANCFWKAIAEELFPLLVDDEDGEDGDSHSKSTSNSSSSSSSTCERDAGAVVKQSQRSTNHSVEPQHHHHHYHTDQHHYWKLVGEYGRALVYRQISIEEWHHGLSLTFEIIDEMDGLRLFSASGPIRVLGTTKPGSLALKLIQPKRYRSKPFCAASRDPEHRRFSSVRDYFSEGHEAVYPCALTIRCLCTCQRTGRRALIFTSAKSTKRWCEPLPHNANGNISAGAVLINQHWSRTSSIPAQKALQLLTVFFVSPVENQGEEVGEADLLYQVLETQSLYITLQFKTESSEEIGQFIRGLLHA